MQVASTRTAFIVIGAECAEAERREQEIEKLETGEESGDDEEEWRDKQVQGPVSGNHRSPLYEERREKEAKVDCTVSQAFRRGDNELIMGQGDPGLAR